MDVTTSLSSVTLVDSTQALELTGHYALPSVSLKHTVQANSDLILPEPSSDPPSIEMLQFTDSTTLNFRSHSNIESPSVLSSDLVDDDLASLEEQDKDTILGIFNDAALTGEMGEDELVESKLETTNGQLFKGTSNNDVYSGGSNNDTIRGRAGDDILQGEAGDDLIDGGADDDIIKGGAGLDSLSGGNGNDSVKGGAGDDLIRGNQGDDILDGDIGTDDVYGDAGNDILRTRNGGDRFTGGRGNDQFWVTSGKLPRRATTVTDFKPGTDLIVIAGVAGVQQFSDLALRQVGQDTIVRARGRDLAILQNQLPSKLSASDFKFEAPSGDQQAPVVTAMLLNDTGSSASDRLTANPSVKGQVTDASAIVSLKAGFDGMPTGTFVDVTAALAADGRFTLDAAQLQQINGGALVDGARTLKLIAQDAAGNTSDVFNFVFTLDTTAPVATTTSTLDTTATSVDISFNEAISDEAFTAANYTLTLANQTVEIASVEKISATQVRLNLGQALSAGEYALIIAAGISDVAGNALAGTETLNFTVNQATVQTPKVEISPANGEGMVALTRETIVRFGRKVDPATVTEDAIYLIANGERIEGRIVVSSTEEFATFFYDQPLPQSTEVRVVVDGEKILDRDGNTLDANNDGIAGGILTADFRTLPLTRIEGTDVWGYVYDSYNRNPDGSNIPLKGVKIRLDSLPDVFAVTDENGYFILEDVPAPEFYVYIDGSDVENAPQGGQYASLGKPFHSIPGQSTQLYMDGAPFDVYLPLMSASDIVELSPNQATDVGFGEASLDFLSNLLPNVDPEILALAKVIFPAGSAIDDNGNAATQAMIVPVDPQRLPAPLPPGADPKLVISIQAGGPNGFNREADGGATNFDVPAPVVFPNLEGLAPGEKSLIWSFDHDAGDWVIIGTGTVSADGKSIESDEGVGIRAPGWHFTNPGTEGEGEGENDEDEFDPECSPSHNRLLELSSRANLPPEVIQALEASGSDIQEIINGSGDYVYDEYSVDIDKMPPGVTPEKFLSDMLRDLNGTLKDGGFDFINKFARRNAGDPKLGEIIDIDILGPDNGSVVLSEFDSSHFTFTTVKTPESGSHPEHGSREFGFEQNPDGSIKFYTRGASRPRDFLVDLFGDLPQSIGWSRLMKGISDAIDASGGQARPNSFQNSRRDKSEAPQCLNKHSAKTLVNLEIANIEDQLTLTQAQELGSSLSQRFFYRIQFANLNNPESLNRETFFEDGSIRSLNGVTNDSGQFSVVLPPDVNYTAYLYNPETGLHGKVTGTTSRSGILTDFGTVHVSSLDTEDSDNDGIGDVGEFVIGTSGNNPDTDGDGILDAAEIEQGIDPLGGQGFPTGIISSLPVRGEAKAVVVEGSALDPSSQTAYVATGSHGLAIVDASQFNNPIILGQLDLLGDATDVGVDANLQLAAVASNSGGLQIVDISDPMQPKLLRTVNIIPNQVEVLNGVAYATVNSSLQAVDLLTGEILQNLALPGVGTVTGMAREGSKLYTFTSGSDIFASIDISTQGAATVLGQLTVSVASSDVGLSVGNGVAYLAGSGLRTINISNPNSPTLISDADFFSTAQNVALNGSGLALVAAEDQGIAIYDISDPQNTNDVLFTINTPGLAQDVAIASGIAFIADGTSGLQVINYLPFDSQGQAPTVTISSAAVDLNANTEGIQIQEGTTIPIQANVVDDVQVRNVELLVNGEVVRNDVSFPFDFATIAPNITPDSDTVSVQVRVTDTGGNTALSNELIFNLVPDMTPPAIVGVSPANGSAILEGRQSVQVTFSEALATGTVDATTFKLLDSTGNVLTPLDIQLRDDDRLVQLTFDSLPIGNYQLVISAPDVTDRAGNTLGDQEIINTFSVEEVTTLTTTDLNSLTPELLAQFLVGEGVTISNVQFTGAKAAGGIFNGGAFAGIDIKKGIILSSGNVANAAIPNNSDGTSTSFGTPGDADLDALIPQATRDAVVLEFDFVPQQNQVRFQYVFGSEEYNEFVGGSFNDVFAFFLDGENIALIPGTTTPVSVNNVNATTNSNLYNNNDPSNGIPTPFGIEFDGFTTVLTAEKVITAGVPHHIKLVIADAGDTSLDSAVFLAAASFSSTEEA
jgi:hypothetical protein